MADRPATIEDWWDARQRNDAAGMARDTITEPERPPPQDPPTKAPPQFWGTGRIGNPPPSAPDDPRWLNDFRAPSVAGGAEPGEAGGPALTAAPPGEAIGTLSPPPGSQSAPEAAPVAPALPEPKAFPTGAEIAHLAPPPLRDAWARDPQFATTLPTTFGPEPPPELARLGPAALTATYGKELAELQRDRETQTKAYADVQERLHKSLPERERARQLVEQAQREYRAGLEAARGPLPELQRVPKAPDMTIRPWLDPEGKNAIVYIAEALGMLAVGVAGVVYRAPLTATKYFRETAEAWRRDQVDAASSKLKQFETEVIRIKSDNDVALKQYEIADKEYAHNVEAKHAMVLSKLNDLKLHDEALQAAISPYEEGLKATKDRITTTSSILTHLEKLAGIQAKLGKAGSDIPTSLFKLSGELVGQQQKLAQTTDPAERADIQRRIDALTAHEQHFLKVQNQMVSDRQLATQEAKEYGQWNLRLGQVPFYMAGLAQLKRDYMTLQSKGLLNEGRTWVEETLGGLKRALPANWDWEAKAAAQGIAQFWPDIVIGTARTFWNDIGVRTKDAFGPLHGNNLDFNSAMGYINRAADRLKDFHGTAQRNVQRLGTRLRGAEAGGAPGALPGAVTEGAEGVEYRLPGAVTEEED